MHRHGTTKRLNAWFETGTPASSITRDLTFSLVVMKPVSQTWRLNSFGTKCEAGRQPGRKHKRSSSGWGPREAQLLAMATRSKDATRGSWPYYSEQVATRSKGHRY